MSKNLQKSFLSVIVIWMLSVTHWWGCVWDHLVNPGYPLAGSLRIATVFQGRKAPDVWPGQGGRTLCCLWELDRGPLLFLSRPGPVCMLSDGNLNSGQNKHFSHWIPHPWPCLVQHGPAAWMALLHAGQVLIVSLSTALRKIGQEIKSWRCFMGHPDTLQRPTTFLLVWGIFVVVVLCIEFHILKLLYFQTGIWWHMQLWIETERKWKGKHTWVKKIC